MPTPKTKEGKARWIARLKAAAAKRKAAGIPSPNIGRKCSSEEIERRRAAIKQTYIDHPEKRKKLSEIAKARGNGKWMKGRKLPHISEANKRRKGKTYEELYGPVRAEIERKKRRTGNERHWEGKPRKRPRPQHDDGKSSRWRRKVFERDNYTCQKCFIKGGILQAHHIKPWAKYPELRHELSNGITVCKKCHVRANRDSKGSTLRPLCDLHVHRIRMRGDAGESYAVLAREYGVSRDTIGGIVRRKIYKDVED